MNRKKLMFGSGKSGKSGPLIAGTISRYRTDNGAYFTYVSGNRIPYDDNYHFEYNGPLLVKSTLGGDAYSNALSPGEHSNKVRANIETITDWNIDMSDVTTMKDFANYDTFLTTVDFSNVSGTNISNWENAFKNTSSLDNIDLSMFSFHYSVRAYDMFTNSGVKSIILPKVGEYRNYKYHGGSHLIVDCPNLEYIKFTDGFFDDDFLSKEQSAADEAEPDCMFARCPKLTTIEVTALNTNNNQDDILLFANYLYPDFVKDTGEYIPGIGLKTVIQRHCMLNIRGIQDGGSINCSFTFNGKEITSIPQKSDGNKFVYNHFIYDAYENNENNPIYLINNNLNKQDAPFGVTTLYEAFANNSDILTVTSSMPLTYLDNCVRTFYNCQNLAQVHFIEPWAYSTGIARNDNEYAQISCYQMFENCTTLYKVTMFNMHHVTNMQEMFYGCPGVESIILPNTNNVKIWDGAFSGCSKLKTIAFVNDKIYDSVTENALHAFESVTSFTGVFNNCSSLTEIVLNLPETESPLQLDRTFANCSNVTKITLNQDPYNQGYDLNLDSTSFSVFQGCSNLRQVIVYGTNAHTIVKNWLNSDLGGTWVEQGDGFYKN